jgi:hypothetical protein
MVYTSAVQTLLDGSFTIPKVAPGAYYVVAYKSGYLSPLSTLSEDALKHPTPEDHKRIAGILPRIVVEAGLPPPSKFVSNAALPSPAPCSSTTAAPQAVSPFMRSSAAKTGKRKPGLRCALCHSP